MTAIESPLNVLIVDDEKKACTNLRNILKEYVDPKLNIAGIAHNTTEAEKQIAQTTPDAVFLDIEMPNENAFQFLNRISPIDFEVVFVTSYDEYAIKAFKLNAVDYILKPISINELQNAVQKLKEKIRYKRIVVKNIIPYKQISDQVYNKAEQNKIVLKDTNSIEVVEFKDIYFIEAQSSYSKITFLKNNAIKEITMSNPLSDYEDLLPINMFYRIHRSYLINCSLIRKILKDDANNIVLKGNITLPVSRRRYTTLIDFLKYYEYSYE